MPTIDYAALTTMIHEALTKNRRANSKSRMRTIEPHETSRILNALKNGMAQVQEDDIVLALRYYGGFVPNSYKGRAEADMITVTVDLKNTQAPTVEAQRCHAQRRPHGRGTAMVGRLRKEGQRDGRLINV